MHAYILIKRYLKLLHSRNICPHPSDGMMDWISIDHLKTSTILTSDAQDKEWVDEEPGNPENVPEPQTQNLG